MSIPLTFEIKMTTTKERKAKAKDALQKPIFIWQEITKNVFEHLCGQVICKQVAGASMWPGNPQTGCWCIYVAR